MAFKPGLQKGFGREPSKRRQVITIPRRGRTTTTETRLRDPTTGKVSSGPSAVMVTTVQVGAQPKKVVKIEPQVGAEAQRRKFEAAAFKLATERPAVAEARLLGPSQRASLIADVRAGRKRLTASDIGKLGLTVEQILAIEPGALAREVRAVPAERRVQVFVRGKKVIVGKRRPTFRELKEEKKAREAAKEARAAFTKEGLISPAGKQSLIRRLTVRAEELKRLRETKGITAKQEAESTGIILALVGLKTGKPVVEALQDTGVFLVKDAPKLFRFKPPRKVPLRSTAEQKAALKAKQAEIRGVIKATPGVIKKNVGAAVDGVSQEFALARAGDIEAATGLAGSVIEVVLLNLIPFSKARKLAKLAKPNAIVRRAGLSVKDLRNARIARTVTSTKTFRSSIRVVRKAGQSFGLAVDKRGNLIAFVGKGKNVRATVLPKKLLGTKKATKEQLKILSSKVGVVTNERGLPIVFTGSGASQKAAKVRNAVVKARESAIKRELEDLAAKRVAKQRKKQLKEAAKKLTPRQRQLATLRLKREEARLARVTRRRALRKRVRVRKERVLRKPKRVARVLKKKIKKRLPRLKKRKPKPKTERQLAKEATRLEKARRKEFKRVQKLLAKRERALPKKIREARQKRGARRTELEASNARLKRFVERTRQQILAKEQRLKLAEKKRLDDAIAMGRRRAGIKKAELPPPEKRLKIRRQAERDVELFFKKKVSRLAREKKAEAKAIRIAEKNRRRLKEAIKRLPSARRIALQRAQAKRLKRPPTPLKKPKGFLTKAERARAKRIRKEQRLKRKEERLAIPEIRRLAIKRVRKKALLRKVRREREVAAGRQVLIQKTVQRTERQATIRRLRRFVAKTKKQVQAREQRLKLVRRQKAPLTRAQRQRSKQIRRTQRLKKKDIQRVQTQLQRLKQQQRRAAEVPKPKRVRRVRRRQRVVQKVVARRVFVPPVRFSLKARQRLKLLQRQQVKTRQKLRQKQLVIQKPIQKQKQKQLQKQIQKLKLRQRTLTATAQKVRLSQKVKLAQKARLRRLTKQKLLQKAKKIKIPKPFLRPRVKKPKFKKNQGFNVFIRERGGKRHFKANVKPLLRKKAFNLGSVVVDKSTAATFQVRVAKKLVKGKDAKRFKLARKFRKPKRRTKIRGKASVERRRFRIDTGGEKTGITAKGLIAVRRAAQRRKLQKLIGRTTKRRRRRK